MTEIYWLTRLESINTFFTIIIAIGIVASILLIGACFIVYLCDGLIPSKFKKVSIYTLIITIILSIISIFIPTTKEAYMIYGIGNTIDYLKEDEATKQLPDKCVKYLDKWIDENLKEEEKQEKRN